MDLNKLTAQKVGWNIYLNSENGFKYPLTNKIKNEIRYGTRKIIEQDQKKKIKVCRPLPTKRRRGSLGSGSVAVNPWN